MLGHLDFVNSSLNTWEKSLWRRPWDAAMQYDPKVDLGQIAVILGLVGAVGIWAVTNGNTAGEAARSVAALRNEMNEQFHQVRLDIANLPDQRAELTQIEKRLDQSDSRADAQSKRVETLERAVIQERADLDNVLRAYGAKK